MVMNRQDIAGLCAELDALRVQMIQDVAIISALYPNVAPERDLRIRQLYLLSNTLVGSIAGLMHMAIYMMDDAWWDSGIPGGPFSRNDQRMFREGFMSTMSLATLVGIFVAVEAPFRQFIRVLAPGAARNGTGGFYNLSRELLGTHLSRPPESIELLDLLRIARNSIHNNGVYFHENAADTSVTYKGVVYDFEHNQQVRAITWSHMCELADDVRQLMVDVAHDPVLLAIQTEIGW